MSHALLEFSKTLVGPAAPDDYESILNLIDHYAKRGEMLPVKPSLLAMDLPDFLVVRDEQGFAGCARLHLWQDGSAEIRSLAVRPHSQGVGMGRVLVQELEKRAQAIGIRKIFALTLKPMFFSRLGYHEADRQQFPAKLAGDCAACPSRFNCREIAMQKHWTEPAVDRQLVWDWTDL